MEVLTVNLLSFSEKNVLPVGCRGRGKTWCRASTALRLVVSPQRWSSRGRSWAQQWCSEEDPPSAPEDALTSKLKAMFVCFLIIKSQQRQESQRTQEMQSEVLQCSNASYIQTYNQSVDSPGWAEFASTGSIASRHQLHIHSSVWGFLHPRAFWKYSLPKTFQQL